MAVQDDAREQELCNLFNLEWDPEHARGGDDAWFESEIDGKILRIPVEVKSTTTDTVSTARDVGLSHISKWREKLWVIGFYIKSHGYPRLQNSLCLTPDEMEPWIAQIEAYILPDYKISEIASSHLTFNDLHAICGNKDIYTIEDAKRIHKKQWKVDDYLHEMDLKNGYSQERMLKILQLRLKYISERGATLNNPHITKSFLSQFDSQRIAKNHAAEIRKKFDGYYKKMR